MYFKINPTQVPKGDNKKEKHQRFIRRLLDRYIKTATVPLELKTGRKESVIID